jgi:hypothetical protein
MVRIICTRGYRKFGDGVSIANDDNCRLTLIKAWQRFQVHRTQLRKIGGGGKLATSCFVPRGPPKSSEGRLKR